MSVKRLIYAIAAAAIILGFVGAYFALRSDLIRNRRLTQEVTATIEDVDVRRAVDPASGAVHTVDIAVRYRYSVNGAEYRRTTTMSGLSADQFVPWGTAKVCYAAGDPATIEAGKLFPASYKCGEE